MDYLDRLRGLGVEERYIELERDAWIVVAAQVPHLIDSVIAGKHEELDHPDMRRLYGLVSGALDWAPDDPRIVELLDTTMIESASAAARLVAILQERGWKGWTRIERVPGERLSATGL